MADHDFTTFGPVHLEVRDPQHTSRFWQKLAGFEHRTNKDGVVEVGTKEETLLVLHPGAQTRFQKGHRGLYHVGIHSPNERDFARLLKRFVDLRYPISPTDHTFSKAIYLEDPDGITFEFALETPERFRGAKVGPGGRLTFVGTDGVERSGGYPLDLDAVLRAYEPGSEDEAAAAGTKIGHVHLHVADLERARDFYQELGMELARWWPAMRVGDLGAGGAFTHRIAINTWQGLGAPLAPANSARMRHFEMRFETTQRLQAAIDANNSATQENGTWRVIDPSGIEIRLTGPAVRPLAA